MALAWAFDVIGQAIFSPAFAVIWLLSAQWIMEQNLSNLRRFPTNFLRQMISGRLKMMSASSHTSFGL